MNQITFDVSRHRRLAFSLSTLDTYAESHELNRTRELRRRLHATSHQLRDEEMKAIVRGLQRPHEYSSRYPLNFLTANNAILICGVFAICLLVAGLLLHYFSLSPLLYAFPVGLTAIYILLIVVLEFRISNESMR